MPLATAGTLATAAAFNAAFPDAVSSYTPTWTAASSNPAIGNGTISGHYIKAHNVVFFRVSILMGSTTTFGTGAWFLTLPTTSAQGANTVVGAALLLDSGTTIRHGLCQLEDTGKFRVIQENSTTTGGIGPTAPHTWAQNDRVDIEGWYVEAS